MALRRCPSGALHRERRLQLHLTFGSKESPERETEGETTETAQPLAGKSRQQPAVWESDSHGHGDGNQIQGFLLQLTFKTKLQRGAVLFDFSALGTRVAHNKRNWKTGNICPSHQFANCAKLAYEKSDVM